MNRREFVRTVIATTTLMAVGATGIFEIAAKLGANQSSAQLQSQEVQLPPVSSQTSQASTQASAPSQSSSWVAPSGYVLVAQVSSLAGKTSAYFDHPSLGTSILLSLNGQWKAFSATCTHRPCTVEFASSEIYCPCHGATFNPSDGSVTRGPAQVALAEYGVIEQNGGVYVSNSLIN